MNFNYTDEQLMIKNSVRKFSEEVLIPKLKKYGNNKPFTKEFMLELINDVKPFGAIGSTIPESLGGAGLDVVEYALIYEELPSEVRDMVGISSGLGRVIAEIGTDYHKEKFLSGILSGEKISCSANTEPNVGSNQANMQTTAYLDGNEWVINGTKTFITNGNNADFIAVSVQLDRSKGAKGVGTIIVDRSEAKVDATPIKILGFNRGDLAELHFDDVRVPKENLLIGQGLGHKRKLAGFTTWRCFVALHAVKIAEEALELSIKYAKGREQFGRQIGAFQMIQDMLAEMKTKIDASRLLAYRALLMIKEGNPARKETSMAKYFATEMAVEATKYAIQIHGANGLALDKLDKLHRTALTLTIPEGTTQIQKLIIGRELTGLSAFN